MFQKAVSAETSGLEYVKVGEEMSEEMNAVAVMDKPVEQVSEQPMPTVVLTKPKPKAAVVVHTPVEVKPKPAYDFVKRAVDIAVSLICLTVGLPVYLIIALAIVIDDPGNPLFIQKRVGKNGKVFNMVKFRTMRKDAEQIKIDLKEQNECESVHFKIKNDPRVTRVGKFLRATSLDETPQAINLLLSHMTVIGPRAFVPEEQSQLPDDRLLVKPGLSCYWQLERTLDMNDEEQLELDYRYIRERGIKTDLKIIWRTVKKIFKGNNF